jgi:tRNA (cmo5U34)-methyltransferase
MQDTLIPAPRWEFGADVTSVFDDMLLRSIPQYDVMRQAVSNIAKAYAVPDTAIIDLGCSRGQALAPLMGLPNRFIGVEISEPMRVAAQQNLPSADIRAIDLRTDYPIERASVTLCILTLQFTPIEYRLQILDRVYTNLLPGGAFILVEKVIGASSRLDSLMANLYYALKGENGYSQEQIERKRLSLEGVLVPVTARWNEELLHTTGFRQVDCFWRWMNFAGWIAVK